jgi:hypothetical protein
MTRRTLLRSAGAALDAAIVETFKLIKESDSRTDLHGTTRIGVYSPYAGFRFPVYRTIQLEPADLAGAVDALTGRVDIPFILLAPSRDLCTAQTEQLLANRNSAFIPLSENVGFTGNRKLSLLCPLDDILSPFRTANLPSPKDNGGMVFFPTPTDAIWGDVSIRFKDGHIVSIKVKSAGGVFNYTQMGMANKKNGDPTVQWELLRNFSDEHGVLDGSSNKADQRNQKRREILAVNLRDFFRIEGDPFRLTDDGKGWQVRIPLQSDHSFRSKLTTDSVGLCPLFKANPRCDELNFFTIVLPKFILGRIYGKGPTIYAKVQMCEHQHISNEISPGPWPWLGMPVPMNESYHRISMPTLPTSWNVEKGS